MPQPDDRTITEDKTEKLNNSEAVTSPHKLAHQQPTANKESNLQPKQFLIITHTHTHSYIYINILYMYVDS